MFDGSHYPIEEKRCKDKRTGESLQREGNVSEAEVGSIGGEEDGVVGQGEMRRS